VAKARLTICKGKNETGFLLYEVRRGEHPVQKSQGSLARLAPARSAGEVVPRAILILLKTFARLLQ
jgi:hypothetical protein